MIGLSFFIAPFRKVMQRCADRVFFMRMHPGVNLFVLTSHVVSVIKSGRDWFVLFVQRVVVNIGYILIRVVPCCVSFRLLLF
jgi:hypothetical protein